MADNQYLKEVMDMLDEGISKVFESDEYKKYLKAMSAFYDYSSGNIFRILMQKPEATRVAPFGVWRKLGRIPQKGTAIKIIAPIVFKGGERIDPETGKPVLDENGSPVMARAYTRYRVEYVFDESDTTGEPLPCYGVDELSGGVKDYAEIFKAVKDTSPYPVAFEGIEKSGTKGYFHLREKRIAIKEGMPEAMNVEILIHEITHAMLHDIDLDNPSEADIEARKNSRAREVEADSVAYVVCQHYGIDTGQYSFAYIAGWSADDKKREFKSSLETIRTTSKKLIDSIDYKLILQLSDKPLLPDQRPDTATPIDILGQINNIFRAVDAADPNRVAGQAAYRVAIRHLAKLSAELPDTSHNSSISQEQFSQLVKSLNNAQNCSTLEALKVSMSDISSKFIEPQREPKAYRKKKAPTSRKRTAAKEVRTSHER